MKELKHIVADPQGVHARPAGELVKLAKTFQSTITVKKDDKVGDCKKIFTIMALGAKAGHELTFTFEGEDEEQAFAAFEAFLKEQL